MTIDRLDFLVILEQVYLHPTLRIENCIAVYVKINQQIEALKEN